MPSVTLVEQFSLDIFPALLMLIVFFNNRVKGDKSLLRRLFGVLCLLVLIDIVSYSLSWVLNGEIFPMSYIVNWAINLLYMLSSCVTIALVTVYIIARVNDLPKTKHDNITYIVMLIPSAAFLLLILITPFTGLLFSIDSTEMTYERESLFWFPYLAYIVSMLALSVFTAVKYFKSNSQNERREYRFLFSFTVLPLPVVVIQCIYNELTLIWPFTSFLLFYVYINLQNKKIDEDVLTGLKNRAELMRNLNLYCSSRGHPFCLMIIDIDDFKSINDVFGHAVGDEALRRIADVMREMFRERNVVLARHGGDEFSVLLSCGSKAGAESLKNNFNKAVESNNARVNAAYKLSVSVGVAFCDGDNLVSADELYRDADQAMYNEKAARKLKA